jgi:hypothetical protein
VAAYFYGVDISTRNTYSKALNFKRVDIDHGIIASSIGFMTSNVGGKEIIEHMDIMRFNYPIYTLLNTYGKPDNLMLYIIEPMHGYYEAPIYFLLDYGKRGMIFEYEFDVFANNPISLCSDQLEDPHIIIWNTNINSSLTYIFFEYPEILGDFQSYETNQSKIGFSIDEFYKAFTQNLSDKNCINAIYPY